VTLTPYQQYAQYKIALGERPSPYDDEAPSMTHNEWIKDGHASRHEQLVTGRKVGLIDANDPLNQVDEAKSAEEAMVLLERAGALAPEHSQDLDSTEPDGRRETKAAPKPPPLESIEEAWWAVTDREEETDD
jgi:hypothetical protein